ncbi:hypothetical protein F4809DRAFT_637889 [Biscogniauxia mediterranea]|nr:hypothetical protein F4809DRAFT_637889 [Biscogniauxia mediterranea]
MVRVTQGPVTPGRSISNPDSLTDLNRLLSRLQQSILQADAERERRLRASEYERNKVRINLEYARTLLTKLEQDALGIKVHTRRLETQTDLNRKREIFEELAERLRELEEVSIDSDDDSEDGEDLLGNVAVIATPSQSSDGRTDRGRGEDDEDEDMGGNWDYGDELEEEEEEEKDADESSILPRTRESTQQQQQQQQTIAPAQPDPEPQNSATGTTTSQTLRPRGAPTTTTTTTAATDKAETTALRNQLFGDRPTPTSSTSAGGGDPTTTATAEAIMDHHRQEQDKLTASMVSMARALKESSQRFSSALREDQDVLAAAGRGLERSERGLDGVAGRMGSLRRLTEGQGWWGRMLLYAWIAGLALAAVLLVFVGPKLRF